MTRRLIPIRAVLEDEAWLGSLIGKPSFRVMRTLLIASMGEPLTPDELLIFTSVTGREEAPTTPVEELWAIAGRRSGKSLGVIAAAYLAACCDYRGVLAKGERGILVVMSGSTQQCGQIFNFLRGIFTNIPKFAAMVRKPPGPRGSGIINDRISLRNSVDVEVRPASFRTIRGITAVAAIAEEISTWQSDESLNPDLEILAAVRPALATTQGPLFCIGSPCAKKGETWKTFRRHFGPLGHPAILVANGATKTFNAVTFGDRYASGFNSELFAKYGVLYNFASMTTSDYFGSFLPILNSPNWCRLLDHKRLAAQLCALERRPSRVGAKDAISHPPGAHDDLAAAVAGLFVRMIGVRDFMPKVWASPIEISRPRSQMGGGSGLPDVISEYPSQPAVAHGVEYQTGDGTIPHWSPLNNDWLSGSRKWQK